MKFSDDGDEKYFDEDEKSDNEYSSDESFSDESVENNNQNNELLESDKISLKEIAINYSEDEIINKGKNSKEKNNETNQNGNDFGNKEDKSVCYANRKSALEWANIANLMTKYACYLSLTKDEADKATVEIYDLITLPFSVIKSLIPSAISKNSKYSNFWSILRGFKYSDKTFSTLYDIATRFYAISASEVNAERAFSKIKWRFNDRRNCVKQKTMMREIHIECDQKKKTKSESDFPILMWKHPYHSE